MLLLYDEEKSIIQWIYHLEEFGFSPRMDYVKEAIIRLKKGSVYDGEVGKEIHETIFRLSSRSGGKAQYLL